MTGDSSSSTRPDDAAVDSFVRQARESMKNRAQVSNRPTLEPEERTRRTAVIGAVVGITVSMVFAFVSQGINLISLPGVSLYRSITGLLTNTFLIILFGTILSLVAVSSLKIQNRIFSGVLILLGLFVLYSFYRDYRSAIGALMQGLAFALIFLIPILFAILAAMPFGFLAQWAVRAQIEYFYKPAFYWKRALPAVLLLIVMILSGMLFVLSAPEQKAVQTMDALMKEGRNTQTKEALPGLLRNIWGTPFYPYARGNYYIIAQHNPLPKRVTANGYPYVEDIFVSAQFQNGYWLTCQFTPGGQPIKCYSGYNPPVPKGTM